MAIRKDSIVFNPGYIGSIKIKNRLIRSATYEHAATKEGEVRSFNVVEHALFSGATDFVALSRPLVREPGLPKRWLSDEGAHRAACISCNACLPIGAEILVRRVSKSIKSP